MTKFPAAKLLMLRNTLQPVAITEIMQFAPHCVGDVSKPIISHPASMARPTIQPQGTTALEPKLASTDITGAAKLDLSRQLRKPRLFNCRGRSTYPKVLGSHWEQSMTIGLQKFNDNHVCKQEDTRIFHTLGNRVSTNLLISRYKSTKTATGQELELSRKDKLKRAVKEYGSTVIVFHVGISLVSLGVCYVLVSSGIDMGKLLVPLGVSSTAVSNTGTFVTAYAIHKVFAPVRISITLAATPFIVRYLRSIGFLRKPKVQ